ncbi:UNVERIFIED_CONTAM: hypothetical protein ABID98_003016 [Brevibacillus sp. OAP136]
MKKAWRTTASLTMAATLLASAVVYTAQAADQEEQAAKGTPRLAGQYELKNPAELGNGISQGGFSALIHLPNDPKNVFYTTTDRGPNGEIKVGDEKRRTFPLQNFTPSIYKISVEKNEITILETIPLSLPTGKDPITGTKLISGVSNLEGEDEVPYDGEAKKKLAYDPYGLDVEGIAYNPKDDTFWLCDEYRPSLVQVKRDGTIIQRLIPRGEKEWFANAPLVPIKDVLPAIYSKRNQNRGFEGVSITPDGKWMFAAVQSPLANPDAKAAKASRVLRIIKIDLKTGKPIAEFAYLTTDAAQLKGVQQYDIVISDLHAINENTLLVDERDKNAGKDAQVKKLFTLNLKGATNVLGKYDEEVNGKTLEQMSESDLKQAKVKVPSKRQVLDLLEYDYPFEKVEGVTMVDSYTVALVNDNDFDIDNTGTTTQLWQFRLPTKLK